MKKVFILIGHGDIPSDFPEFDLKEYLKLRTFYKRGRLGKKAEQKFKFFEEKLKKWKRTPENDIHYHFLSNIVKNLERNLKVKVEVAFNEFCYPSVEEKIEEIVDKYQEFFLIPSMIAGGKHTEIHIKNKIGNLNKKYPDKKFFYIYPFRKNLVLEFFKKHIEEFLS